MDSFEGTHGESQGDYEDTEMIYWGLQSSALLPRFRTVVKVK